MTKSSKLVLETVLTVRKVLEVISINNLTNIRNYIKSGYPTEFKDFVSCGTHYDIISVSRKVLDGQITTETHLKCDASSLFTRGTRDYLSSINFGIAVALRSPALTCTVKMSDPIWAELIYIQIEKAHKSSDRLD